jgi:hypothetical protein
LELEPTLIDKCSVNNWGQININLQSKEIKGKRGFLILEYQKSFSPLTLYLL